MRRVAAAVIPAAVAFQFRSAGGKKNTVASSAKNKPAATQPAAVAVKPNTYLSAPGDLSKLLPWKTIFPAAPAEAGLERKCMQLLCTWSDTQGTISVLVTDLGTGAQHPASLQSFSASVGPWLKSLSPAATHAVWFLPTFVSSSGVAVQAQFRQPPPGSDAHFRGLHHALVSLRQVRAASKLSESSWPLVTLSDSRQLLLHLQCRWSLSEWQTFFSRPQNFLVVSPTVMPKQQTQKPPSAAAAPSIQRAAVQPPTTKVDEALKASVKEMFVKALQVSDERGGTVSVFVSGTMGPQLHLMDPFRNGEAVAAASIKDMHSSDTSVIPVFLVVSKEAEDKLRASGLLTSETTPGNHGQLRTVRPHFVRLHDVEVFVHRAIYGVKPPPATTSAPLHQYTAYAVDRSVLWRAIGVPGLLSLATKRLTVEEWRALLRRGHDGKAVKDLDANPEKLEAAIKERKRRQGEDSPLAECSKTSAPLPAYALRRLKEDRSELYSMKTSRLIDVDGYMRSLFGCPRRQLLESAAAREMLPRCGSSGGVFTLSLSTVQRTLWQRADNPWSGEVTGVTWRLAQFHEEGDGLVGVSQPADTQASGHIAAAMCDGNGFMHACQGSLRAATVVAVADAKRAMLYLRRDKHWTTHLLSVNAGAPGCRLWCVLYAQYILSGFREKYASIDDVLKLYTNSNQLNQFSSEIEKVNFVYPRQVHAAALGRCLLSIRERMEGLVASSVMEMHGVCVEEPQQVEKAMQSVDALVREADATVMRYLGTVFTGTSLLNFNWRSQPDVSALLLGGGLTRLAGAMHRSQQLRLPAASRQVTLSKKPVLHRYLLEVFGVPAASAQPPRVLSSSADCKASPYDNAFPLYSPPPQEQYSEASLTATQRAVAKKFIGSRTTFVVLSLKLSSDDSIFAASLFIPGHAAAGGGTHVSARLVTNHVRHPAAAAYFTIHGVPSRSPVVREGVSIPDASLPLMSLEEFRDWVRECPSLVSIRNEVLSAALLHAQTDSAARLQEPPTAHQLVAQQKNEKATAALPGHPLDRIAPCPPSVVFLLADHDTTAERVVTAAIHSGLVQTVCEALEVQQDECVGFVAVSKVKPYIQHARGTSKKQNAEQSAVVVPNFAKDFEALDKVGGELRDGVIVWLGDVLGCSDALTVTDGNRQAGVGAAPHQASSLWADTKGALLEALHAAMLEAWELHHAPVADPFLAIDCLPGLPPKWLTNYSAMVHPQQTLYLEGYVWRTIRTVFAQDKSKRVQMCADVERLLNDAAGSTSSENHSQSTLASTASVKNSVLEGLIDLWKENNMDCSLLEALHRQRTLAKIAQLFQPDKLLRVAVTEQLPAALGGRSFHAIHADIVHTSTNTGRLASQTPCIHNIPKDGVVRKLFVSRFGPADGILIEADYSQLEVVVLALLCGDKQMIAELNDNVDFHCLRVSLMKKEPYDSVFRKVKSLKDPEYINLRQLAKVFSFQRQYGAGIQSICSTTGLTTSEVQALIAAEEAHYPELTNYYKLVQSSINVGAQAIATKHRAELLTTAGCGAEKADLLRRLYFIEPRRYFPVLTGSKFDFSADSGSIPKQKNHPVQGFAGELVQTICGRLVRKLQAHVTSDGAPLAYLTNSVHDCVWVDAHVSVSEQVEKDVREVMQNVSGLLKEVYWDGCSVRLSPEEAASLDTLAPAGPPWATNIPFPVTVHKAASLAFDA